MDELIRLLHIQCGPATDGKEFLWVVCGVDFEPHGIASEDWEVYWTLTMPQIPWHYHNVQGWQRATTDRPMSFCGRTFNEVVGRAIGFLKDKPQ